MFETPHNVQQASFARGEVSPYLFGRVDVQAYASGLRTCRNMVVRPEGSVENRPGFVYVASSVTYTSLGSILMPFVFSASQSYVLEVGAGTAQVFSQGAVVLNGGSPVTFSTPWSLTQFPTLRWAQSADTLTVVHPLTTPYEIKRTSATAFTCSAGNYSGGPFLPQNSDGVTFVYASAATGTVTLTANSAIFNANQVGGLFQLTQQDLSPIPPWEPNKQIVNPVGLYRRSNLKNYKCVAVLGTGTTATGYWQPAHSQGSQADGDGSTIPNLANSAGLMWQYQDSGTGIVLITGYTSPTQVTGIVQPNYVGGPGLLPTSCVGGPQVLFGPFTFSGNGSTTAFSPLTGVTSTDPTKYLVTINGVYQSPSTYTISGTTITFLSPPANGASIIVKNVSFLGMTSYWAFGAFSADQGYPSAVTYFPDRLVFAATSKQPVGVFGSQTSQYHNFAVSNPVLASDAFTVFLNARSLNAISDLIPLSDLLVGTSNILWRLWPGTQGTALSPLANAATAQSYYGVSPSAAACLVGDSAIFAEYDGRRLRDMLYQLAVDKFVGQELTLYARHLLPFGTIVKRIAYKPDAAGQFVFALRSDGTLLCCNYIREQQLIGWSRWDTQGTFEDICVVPEGTQFTLYAIVNRTINGATVRYVEKLASRETTTAYDYQFLDCAFTYDGRNTSSTTMKFTGGTTWLAGDTVTVTASSTSGWTNFTAADITNGNDIWLFDASGNRCRAKLTAYVSATVATAMLRDPCPTTLQGIGRASWTFARTVLSGATALPSTPVVALVDANVVGIAATGTAPNGALTVTQNGGLTLPSPGGVVQVGLPYMADFETLPLNEQGQETIRMRAKTQPVVFLDVTGTRNFLIGTDFTTMAPNVQRAFETYTAPTTVQEGIVWTRIQSELTSECHSCIRQNMPLPITIRGIIPAVGIGEVVS